MKRFIKKNWRVFVGIFPWMFLMSTGGYASYMYNGLEITPSASVQEGYDDNITYVKNNPISDAFTQLLAELAVKQEGKTESLSLDTKIEEELYAQHSSLDNTSEYMNLDYKQDFSEYDHLKVTDVFSHAEQPTSFANAFGSTPGFYFTYQNTLDMAYHHDLTEQLGANFRYSNDLLDFSNTSMSNSSLNTVGTGLEYAFDSATILKTDYDYNYREFYPGPSATENEVSAGVRRYLTPQLYADLRSGADFINSFNGQNYIQPLYKASLTNDLDETTQTGISFEKQYTTNGWNQDLFNEWRVSGNYIKDLTSRTTATLNVFYGNGDYISTNINEKYTGASIGVSYELTKKAKVTLSYTFSKDDSTLSTNSYTKNVVYLGTKYEF
jgi:hypothetical protein